MKKDVLNSRPLAAVPGRATPAAKLAEIAACLQQLPPQALAARPGFSGGALGSFLFLYAHAAHTGCAASAKAAQQHLQLAVEHFFSLSSCVTYYRELAEFGTLLLYLREQEYLDESFEALLAQVDVRLGHGLAVLTQQQLFDSFLGYLPVAHYFLQRRHSAPASLEALRLVVDTLLRDYQPQAGGETGFWESGIFGKRQVYLGWSHGLAGIILFLTQLLATPLGYRRVEVRQVLAGATQYLRLPHARTGHNQYPDIVGQPRPSNTLNLCYGDLGIGYALLQAAHVLADDGLRQHALHTLAQCAARRQPAQCQVFDASLIYGASGNALFFKFMQQQVAHQPLFGEAAAYWYEQAQALSQHPGQVAGYHGHYNQHVPSAHYSLFEGLAGLGLVLLEFEIATINPLPLLGYPTCL